MSDLLPQIEKVSLVVFLVSTMLAVGLMLTLSAIIAPLRDARLVLLALGLNFVLAPAFAWLLTAVIPLDRGYAIGLLLLGGPKPEVRGVLGLATTGRNFGAALVPAASSFSDPKVTLMIVVGAIVSFIAAGWVRRRRTSAPA